MTNSTAILGWMLAPPVIGGAVVLTIPTAHARRPWIGARAVALVFGIATLVVAGRAAGLMEEAGSAIQWRIWLKMDALAMPLVLLVAGMGLVALWSSYAVKQHVNAYFSLAQFFVAAMLGALLATQALALCLFLLVAVILLYELLARWGGDRKIPAARRFLMMTVLGTVCLFVGLWMRMRGGMISGWNIADMPTTSNIWSFWLALAGWGLLGGLVPLHGWMPGALAEPSTPVAMLVACGMRTLAGYVTLRCLPLFGDQVATHRELLGLLGACSLVYGALAALGQTQLKRMAAYVSTALMGFFLLGLAADNPAARTGVTYVLCGQALALGMLLFVAGMIEDRMGHCELARLGGLSGHMPGFAGWGLVGILGAMGLPGLCVFGGELLVVIGAFQRGHSAVLGGAATPHFVWLAALATGTIMLLLAGGVWTYQRVFMGVPRVEHSNLARMSLSERWILAVLGAGAIVVGLWPGVIFQTGLG